VLTHFACFWEQDEQIRSRFVCASILDRDVERKNKGIAVSALALSGVWYA
jgi:hypothetical protein